MQSIRKRVDKMRLLKRIKWENIAALGVIAVSVMSVLHHIELNGIYPMILIEIAMYSLSVMGIRYAIKDLRTNLENWLLDK